MKQSELDKRTQKIFKKIQFAKLSSWEFIQCRKKKHIDMSGPALRIWGRVEVQYCWRTLFNVAHLFQHSSHTYSWSSSWVLLDSLTVFCQKKVIVSSDLKRTVSTASRLFSKTPPLGKMVNDDKCRKETVLLHIQHHVTVTTELCDACRHRVPHGLSSLNAGATNPTQRHYGWPVHIFQLHVSGTYN